VMGSSSRKVSTYSSRSREGLSSSRAGMKMRRFVLGVSMKRAFTHMCPVPPGLEPLLTRRGTGKPLSFLSRENR
jgi:hypothetical protein